MLTRKPLKLQLEIHRTIVTESIGWIGQSPHDEVGGKYIGRIHGEFDATAPDWYQQLRAIRLEVIHHLDCGPSAERSPTYHRPDGRYQEALFRAVEAKFPDVRHLGSWHSHHPNGLGMLSGGDVRGYLRDVNSPQHGHDLFLASLAIDRRGLGGARHYLFVRGRDLLFEVDPTCVTIVEGHNAYSDVIDDFRQRASLVPASDHRPGAAGNVTPNIILDFLRWCWEFFIDIFRWAMGVTSHNWTAPTSAPDSAPRQASPVRPVGLPRWATTEAGKAALARDRAWISNEHPELKLVIRSGVLVWTGVMKHDDVLLKVTIAYPVDYPAAPPTVDVQGKYQDVETEVRAVLRPDDSDTYRKHLYMLLNRCADALWKIGGGEPYKLGRDRRRSPAPIGPRHGPE